MARLAFFTPMPPAATGIADYSVDVLRILSPSHVVDVFHDQDEPDVTRLPGACRAHRASEFAERDSARPYDLCVYQLGNGMAHGFLYEWLARRPGLLVLHDLVLHHSRARMFLESPEALAYAREPASAEKRQQALVQLRRYRDEVTYCYPGPGERLADAHLETVGTLLPYAYPLFRLPVEASLATAVHNACMRRAVADEVPQATLASVSMPIQRVGVPPQAVAAVRARYAIAADETVVGSFGLLTPEKRVDVVARAVARARALGLRLRLLLVGPVPDPRGLWDRLAELGLRDHTVMTGRVPFAELPAYIEAADLVAHLRYPTARETSAALLRVLAQGRATVLSDLENLAEVPEDAVVRADVTDEEGELLRAILRLAARRDERERLGRRAAEFVARCHSSERCLATYEAAIEAALRSAAPAGAGWPEHWKDFGAH